MERTSLDSNYPLDGADLRVQRAQEHFRDIKIIVAQVAEQHREGVFAYGDSATGEHHALGVIAPPLQLSIRVGEMLYNLKAALDYIVHVFLKHALAEGRIDQKRFENLAQNVQFVIKDDQTKFAAWRKDNRKWLTKQQGDLIQSVQPCHGGGWAKFLGDLYHTLDKHRELQPLTLELELAGGHLDVIPVSSDVPAVDAERMAREKPVGVYRGGSSAVAFSDGSPIIETLRAVQRGVSDVIDSAHPTLY